MKYHYLGFRHGWVRLGKHMIGWHDAAYFPYLSGRKLIGSWKVWVK